MELADFEKAWKDNDDKLDKSLQLNEKSITNIMKNAQTKFLNVVQVFELGKNLALVYCFISIYQSFKVLHELWYSVLGLMGALLMLWSFLYHNKHLSPLTKIEYEKMPVVDLQKLIRNFRIRSLNVLKYDFIVVAIWLFTLIPIVTFRVFDTDIYSSGQTALIYVGGFSLIVLASIPLGYKMYQKMYEQKLKDSEDELLEIIEFQQ